METPFWELGFLNRWRVSLLLNTFRVCFLCSTSVYWNMALSYNSLLSLSPAAAAKLHQLCPTLCDPIDGSPPGSSVPGILQARRLEWVAISFSNAWKWKWKWSRSVVSDSSWLHGLHGLQPTRLLRPWDFPGKSTGVGCHCLLLFRLDHSYILSSLPYDWLMFSTLLSSFEPTVLSKSISQGAGRKQVIYSNWVLQNLLRDYLPGAKGNSAVCRGC